MIPHSERYRGCLLGLAIGDCLGAPVEFNPPGSFPPVTGLLGGGPFQLQPGQWTDDTSMALCLAASLVECQAFDPADQLARYLRWYREGYMSSTGVCFDIGTTTEQSIKDFEAYGWTTSRQVDPQRASNGSLMRLAPAALAYAGHPALAVASCAETSLTTHAAPAAVDACRYLGALLVGALAGAPREELLSPFYQPVPGLWEVHPLDPLVEQVAAGSFLQRQPPQIRNGSEAVNCLEAALWGFANSADFAEGALRLGNLGDDADTAAAVYGQLAGAYYGLSAIPPAWREGVQQAGMILTMADQLYQLSKRIAAPLNTGSVGADAG